MNSCFLLSRPGYERRFEIKEAIECDDTYSPTAFLPPTRTTGNDPIPFLLPVMEHDSESDYESDIELDDKGVNTDFPRSVSGLHFNRIFHFNKTKNINQQTIVWAKVTQKRRHTKIVKTAMF